MPHRYRTVEDGAARSRSVSSSAQTLAATLMASASIRVRRILVTHIGKLVEQLWSIAS